MKINQRIDMYLGGFLYKIYSMVLIGIIIFPLSFHFAKTLIMVGFGLSLMLLIISIFFKNSYLGDRIRTILILLTMYEVELSISTLRYIIINNEFLKEYKISSFANLFLYKNEDFYTGIDSFLMIILFILLLLCLKTVLKRYSSLYSRFDIDSIPGKLLSIEADYNNGKISEKESRRQKYELQNAGNQSGAFESSTNIFEYIIFYFIGVIILKLISSILIGVFFNDQQVVYSFILYSMLIFEDTLFLTLPVIFNLVSMFIQIKNTFEKENEHVNYRIYKI